MPARRSPITTVRRAFRSPLLLWIAFLLAHLALGLLNIHGYGYPLGDVTSVYKYWSDQALIADFWVGIDEPWVYPVVAILPMIGAQALYPIVGSVPGLEPLTAGAELYARTWVSLMMLANIVAFGVLTGWGRRTERFGAAWWWIAFLVALGPIALGRIDAVTVPVAIIGVLFLASRPRAATVLLTVAAWIKVWPGAIVIAMVIAMKHRSRVFGIALATSASIAVIALAFGSGANVLSFVTQQTGRGLQVEAPVTTYWMWLAWAGVPGSSVYYDHDILTWQVTGAGVDIASAVMTPLLVLVLAAIALLGVLAVRSGASANAVLPPLVLALVTGMIAFQKVGSPQFISWLAVPVILGLVASRARQAPSFRTPALLVLLLAGLTHIIYPYLYGYLLGLYPEMLAVLTARNVLLFVLLGWAILALRRSLRWEAPSSDAAGNEGWRTRGTADKLKQDTP